jgi:hypothetical protein
MSVAQPDQPRILLIGSGHWGNPGLDMIAPEFDDMLSPHRQREIADCVGRLAAFAPTKVALEAWAEREDQLQDEYRRYHEGTFTLGPDERHQLGFRLAAACGHDRMYGIDWHDLEREIGWGRAIDFAKAHGQLDLIAALGVDDAAVKRKEAEETATIRRKSVTEMILDAYAPASLAESHKVYADMALIGEGESYIGADVILRWYERNLKIFVNLSRSITSPEDRIVAVIGAGHLPLLTHFIAASGRYALESPVTYLN